MKYARMLAAIALFPLGMHAQVTLPSGTILPVSLNKGLDARKVHTGQEIRGEVMQNVPGTPVHRGARVIGQVVRVTSTNNGTAKLEIRFDSVEIHGRKIPMQSSLRALASFMEVEEAQIPEDSPDSGLTPDNSTTQQIGGEQVYRGGGPVAVGNMTVGKPVPNGVLAAPRVQAGKPCRGPLGENTRPQAFWLFSSNACGVYGFSNIRIEHAGRTQPMGTITLEAVKGKLAINSGSGFLLRVQGS